MSNMKNSGIEWIREIPEKWQVIRAKFVFTNKKEVVGKRHSDFERLSLTMQGVLKRSKEASDGLQPEKFDNYQILRENELVFKLIDLENTNTSRVGLSPFVGLVSPAYIVLRNEQKDNRYFFYQYMSLYYRNVFNDLGGDGVRSALNPKDLLEMKVVLPSHLTQISIANFLDDKCIKIDALIANEEKIILELKEYKKSIINKYIEDNFAKWELKRFSAIFELGKGLGITKEDLKDEGVFVVSYGEIHSKYGRELNPDIHDLKCVDNAYLESGEKSLLKCGDFAYADTSEDLDGSGNFTFLNGKQQVFAGYHTIIARPKIKVNSLFLSFLLDSYKYRAQIQCEVVGVKVFSITKSILKKTILWLPPLPEQKAIAKHLDKKCVEIDELIAIKQQKISELKEYKKSLIYEVVTGKREIV